MLTALFSECLANTLEMMLLISLGAEFLPSLFMLALPRVQPAFLAGWMYCSAVRGLAVHG